MHCHSVACTALILGLPEPCLDAVQVHVLWFLPAAYKNFVLWQKFGFCVFSPLTVACWTGGHFLYYVTRQTSMGLVE